MAEVETVSDICSMCNKSSPMLKLLQCNHRCCLACLDSTTSRQLHLDDNDLQQCSACRKLPTASSDVEQLIVDAVRDVDWVQIDRADVADVVAIEGDGGERKDTQRAEKVDETSASSTFDKLVHGGATDAKLTNHLADGSVSERQDLTNSESVETKTDTNNNKDAVGENISQNHLKKDEPEKSTGHGATGNGCLSGVEILDQSHSEAQRIPSDDKPISPQIGVEEVDDSTSVSDTKDLCKNHPGEVLTIFCKTCDQPMCVQCFLQDHKTHSVEDIKVAREHVRSKLAGFIDRMSAVLSLPETAETVLSEQLVAARKGVDESAKRLHETVDRDAQVLRDTVASQEAEIHRRKSAKEGHKQELEKLRTTCRNKAEAGQELVDWNEIKELNKKAESLEAKLGSMAEDKSRSGSVEKATFVAFDLEKCLPPNEKNLVGKVSFGQQDAETVHQTSYCELQDQLHRETRHKTELQSEIELLRQRDATETGRADAALHDKLQQLRNDLELERERHRNEMSKLRQEHSEQLKQLAQASDSSTTDAQAQREISLTNHHLVELDEAQAKIATLQKTIEERDTELSRLKRNQEEQELHRSAQTAKQYAPNIGSVKVSLDEDLSLAGLADYNAKVLKEDDLPSSPVKRRSSSGLTKSTRTLSTDVDSDPVKVQTTPESKSNAVNRRQSDLIKSSAKSPTTATGVEAESTASDANLRPSDVVKSQQKLSTTTSGVEAESTTSYTNVRPSDVVKSQLKSSTSTSSGVEAESTSDANVRPSDVVRSQLKSSTSISVVEAESTSSDANVRPSDVVKSQQLKSSTTATVNHRPTLESLKTPSKDATESTISSPLSPDSRRNQNAANAVKQLSPGVMGQYGSVIDCAAVWKAYQEVLDDKSPTQWLILGHEDKKIVVLSTGNTYQQFQDTLTDDQGLYGFVRLTSGDGHAKLPKFVLIMWVGSNVPAPQAAMMTLGKAHVTAIIENRMLEVRASSLQEIEEHVLLEALRKVGGSI